MWCVDAFICAWMHACRSEDDCEVGSLFSLFCGVQGLNSDPPDCVVSSLLTIAPALLLLSHSDSCSMSHDFTTAMFDLLHL